MHSYTREHTREPTHDSTTHDDAWRGLSSVSITYTVHDDLERTLHQLPLSTFGKGLRRIRRALPMALQYVDERGL